MTTVSKPDSISPLFLITAGPPRLVIGCLSNTEIVKLSLVAKVFRKRAAEFVWTELQKHPDRGNFIKHASIFQNHQLSAIEKIDALTECSFAPPFYRIQLPPDSTREIVNHPPGYHLEMLRTYTDYIHYGQSLLYAIEKDDKNLFKSIPLRMVKQDELADAIELAAELGDLEKIKKLIGYYQGLCTTSFHKALKLKDSDVAIWFLENTKLDASEFLFPTDAYSPKFITAILKSGNFIVEKLKERMIDAINSNSQSIADLLGNPHTPLTLLILMRDIAILEHLWFNAWIQFPERYVTTKKHLFDDPITTDINLNHRINYVQSNTPIRLQNKELPRLKSVDRSALIERLDREIAKRSMENSDSKEDC